MVVRLYNFLVVVGKTQISFLTNGHSQNIFDLTFQIFFSLFLVHTCWSFTYSYLLQFYLFILVVVFTCSFIYLITCSCTTCFLLHMFCRICFLELVRKCNEIPTETRHDFLQEVLTDWVMGSNTSTLENAFISQHKWTFELLLSWIKTNFAQVHTFLASIFHEGNMTISTFSIRLKKSPSIRGFINWPRDILPQPEQIPYLRQRRISTGHWIRTAGVLMYFAGAGFEVKTPAIRFS